MQPFKICKNLRDWTSWKKLTYLIKNSVYTYIYIFTVHDILYAFIFNNFIDTKCCTYSITHCSLVFLSNLIANLNSFQFILHLLTYQALHLPRLEHIEDFFSNHKKGCHHHPKIQNLDHLLQGECSTNCAVNAALRMGDNIDELM